MIRLSLIACIVLSLSASAFSQSDTPPANLAQVPVAIKTLPWKSIDVSKVSPLEYSRALLIMNNVLDGVVAWRTSEADLMSQYIDENALGEAFTKAPPPPDAAELSFSDGIKVAIAMLRGPMANSTYASQLSGLTESSLQAYRNMYQRTCERRWSEFAESRQDVRYMSAFLTGTGKIVDYQKWATVECKRREDEYKQQLAQNKAAAESAQEQRVADAEQAKKLAAENEQLQQAMASAQPDGSSQQVQSDQGLANNGYGYAYDNVYVPGYYGVNAGWARDAAYAGAARANTERRVAGWNGAAGVRLGGGGGRGGSSMIAM